MKDNLLEAMGLIRVSMSHINNLEKELEVTKVALDERTQLLDQEIKKNIKLNDELEKLRSDFAQLSLEFNRQKRANISNASNRVGEALSKLGTQETTNQPHSPAQSEISSNVAEKINPVVPAPSSKEDSENPDIFNLTGLAEGYKAVLLKTKHLHKFLVSRLDIPRPRLKLWLTDGEVETFLQAKNAVLSNRLQVTTFDSDNDVPVTLESQLDNTNDTPDEDVYVTKRALLRDIEVPKTLQEIVALTIDIFGDSIDIAQVLVFSTEDKQSYNRPVALTLSALQTHLKRRIKDKTTLKLSPQSHKTSIDDSDNHACKVLGPTQNYTTKRGKLLTGWFIDFLPRELVESVDPYTFSLSGSFFVREKHHDELLKAIDDWNKSKSIKDGTVLEARTSKTLDNSIPSHQLFANTLDTQIAVLDKQFTFRFSALKNEELFSFKSEDQSVIAFNLNHQYIKMTSSQLGRNFWESLKMFIALWATAKVNGLPVNADENSQIAKADFMRCLKEHVGECTQYVTEFTKLPHSVLFDYRSTESGMVLLVNDSHPFNETYVQSLPDIEKNIFIQLYAAWLHAERSTLSNITEKALRATREMLGLHFYHLVDEINHGGDYF